MITRQQIDTLQTGGGDVLGPDGEKIGGIGGFYVDDDTDQPNWVTVKTGLFGTHESFVPLESATVQGQDLQVPYTKDQVKDAPRVDPDGHLEPGEEERLYRHYRSDGQGRHAAASNGLRGEGVRGEYAEPAGYGEREGYAGDRDAEGAGGTVGRDTSGPSTDDAMTRSEQRVNVGTEQQEAGRARLRKYVTTENVTKTVPVQREEVRLEREPITDENRSAAMDGPEISEEEHEVTLHEERPVVEKETVPVERVRLGKETHTDEETVNEEVAKEHIDTEGIDEGRQA
ncbi:YsnF/AvaK domain-containing protein [Sinomonas humi]|uniref:Photosystem reaction center subunit H n=1 Tax=Sinomonas humi TaxID=1338436 RepID=A0A0B2AFF4_9MICC|nr:YsnF/AvaK domain-containing protein [Sinomonas humi]KHL01960.1 photosystem reaction center subunit H [Sinomonas humi]